MRGETCCYRQHHGSLVVVVVAVVVGFTAFCRGTMAGPFYECRLGSEERYQVNLCVDRCPEVGSSRGCSGNRTCCLVGCARICFHERKTTVAPTEAEPMMIVTPQTYYPEGMHYVRDSGSGSGSTSTASSSGKTATVASSTETELLTSSTNNELKDFTSNLALTSTFSEGSGATSDVDPSTDNNNRGNRQSTTTLSILDSIQNDQQSSAQVLGKLRFSSKHDKSAPWGDQTPVVKPLSQWNGVTDNLVNALDDAQYAASKGSDSSIVWQIFEFLRIIQSKLDVINYNSQQQTSKWASMVSSSSSSSPLLPPSAGEQQSPSTVPVRSKPALSPNDPNIVIRKSLFDFSKTLSKVQSELAVLSSGQQQLLRLLERVFVNQLRLVNGAVNVVAHRQQRWQQQSSSATQQHQQQQQQQRQPPKQVNQLAPLTEAFHLDNVQLMAPTDFGAPDCYRLNGCSFDVCRMTTCPKHPDATCRINSCLNCSAEFFVGNAKVSCN